VFPILWHGRSSTHCVCPQLPGTDASSRGARAEMGPGGQRGIPAAPCSVLHSVPAGSQEARGPSKSQLQLRLPLTGEGVGTSGRGQGRVPEEQLPDASGRGHNLGLDTRLVVHCWGDLSGPTLPRSLRTPRCGCKQGVVPILKTQPASRLSAPGPRAPIPTRGGTEVHLSREPTACRMGGQMAAPGKASPPRGAPCVCPTCRSCPAARTPLLRQFPVASGTTATSSVPCSSLR